MLMREVMEPLMSRRYISLGDYSRPKFVDILKDVPMPLSPLVSAMPSPPITRQPFRLLDLPLEVQRLIYEQYFGPWDVTLKYERLSMLRSKFHIRGAPPLDLLLTCWSVCREAREIRMLCFTGRLILNSVFLLVPLNRQDRFAWLRDNVCTLHFSDSSIHPERWNRYYDSFRNLRKLEIEFPNVIPLSSAKLEDILEGKEDETLVKSLDSFRLALVETVSGPGKIEVVVGQRYRQREGIDRWTGAIHVKIRLSDSSGAEVIKRSYHPEIEDVGRRAAELTRANGNLIDAGSHRSIWEWWSAMHSQ